jgi:hypothetical protein
LVVKVLLDIQGSADLATVQQAPVGQAVVVVMLVLITAAAAAAVLVYLVKVLAAPAAQ